MKVKFTGIKYIGTYAFKGGDVKDVPDAEAKRLVETFPETFSYVKAPDPKKEAKPGRTKMMRPGKTK